MTLSFASGLLMLVSVAAALLGSAGFLLRQFPALRSRSSPERDWLDGLRGIAVLLVVLNHAPLVVHNLQLQPTGFVLGEQSRTLLHYFGSVGIQLFFCITGCLFAKTLMPIQNVDWALFFFKRLRRLMPAYTVAVMAAVLIVGFFSQFDRSFVSSAIQAMPRMLAFGFYPLPRIGTFETVRLLGVNWTLAFEWRFYLFIPLVFALSRLGKAPGGVAIAVVATTLLMVEGMGVWMFFALGALASPVTLIEPTESQSATARAALFVAVGSMSLNWATVDQTRILQGLHVLVMFMSVAIGRPRMFRHRSLVALGTFSYSLYLLHVMLLFAIFGFCNIYVVDVAALSPLPFTVLLCGAIALVTALSAISYLWLERRFIDMDARPEARPIR